MDKEELLKLIKKGETQRVEFKSKADNGFGKSICSFANTNDGIILLGVGDDRKVVGCYAKFEREIANLAHACKPSVYPEVIPVELERKNVFVVKVKKSNNLHSFRNIAYKRIASHDKPLSPEEVIEHAQDVGKIRWDEQVCEGAGLEDIDWDFVEKEFIPLYEEVSENQVVGKPVNLLISLGCIKNNNPTNAGILLFGKKPQEFFRNDYIALARYKGKEVSVERLDYKEFSGNIFEQIDRCNSYILEHTSVMSKLEPGKVRRLDIPEYGKFSVRELITNAVCHRNYENQHTKVIIKIFSDNITFYNPGGLPKNITPANIIEKQFSRNPVIANILARVQYIEELGEGWDKIFKEHKEHPLKPKLPAINTDRSTTLITIFSTKQKFEKEKVFIQLNERQTCFIEELKMKESLTRVDYEMITNASKRTAIRDLNDLLERKVILEVSRSRTDPNKKYRLT